MPESKPSAQNLDSTGRVLVSLANYGDRTPVHAVGAGRAERESRSRCIWRASIVWAAVCLALVLPCSAAEEAAKPGTISGRVLDETGAVIPAATVLVRSPKGDTRTAAADDLGAYEVSGLAPGRYSVRAVAQGYVPYEEVWVEMEAGGGRTIDLPCASLSRSKS